MTDPATVGDRFGAHLHDAVLEPLRDRIEAYGAALGEAVASMDAIDDGGPAHDPDGTEETRSAARLRLRYADRFGARFGPRLFDDATRARAALAEELKTVADSVPSLPETIPVPGRATATTPELVRPDWSQRIGALLRRGEPPGIPASGLASLYLSELLRQLEPVANEIARLTAVAVARVRSELHAHTELGGDDADAPPSVEAAVAAVLERFDAVVLGVRTEFDAALRSTAVRVPDGKAASIRDQAVARLDRLMDDWTDFERTLMANVEAEAVLARALASIEAVAAETARRIEGVRDRYGTAPLDRLADGLQALGRQAEAALTGEMETALGELADEAERLFGATAPTVDELRSRLEEVVEELVAELGTIPGQVPEDLHISESPVPRIPERPRKLQLREAPLEELLNTACGGTLPRFLEKSLASATEELRALGQELARVRNAVAFQLRAPLRGGFDPDEVEVLVAGIADRAIAQLEDLRAGGLSSIDALVAGLEERAGDEADALRSAVANREFMRIHSEIAEEQAVRQISSGVERARTAAGGLGRSARATWSLGRRAITAVQDWAERQLGVGEVEREVMLESLEQSLLGQDQQVVRLPTLYRQLFDVEADVPWAELLVPRDEELAVIQRAFDRWVEDRSATLAIVGEKGSGKTTLLRLAEERVFGDNRIVRVGLGRSVDDPGELRSRLVRSFELDDAAAVVADEINGQPPAVAIVEDLHHLFVRALGGFEAMEAFLEVVTATRANVLWVVTVDEFAWRYLDRVVGIDAHFVHKVSTTDLPPEKLEQAIMARHDVSGFALRFETSTAEPGDGRWARLLGRQARGELTRKESHRRLYFQKLAEIAEGNIVLALFYWLRSIRRTEEHVLVLGDPEIIDLEFLDRLPLAHLHSIAAIILHGGLSEAAHQRVFQLPPVESRLQLAALADSHMVFLARDGEYKINKVLYRPFIRMLTSRNIF
ncbi:MAG: hypothetical protein ACN0LA_03130 [Candidatus Longimicrobiales bacterium M2_2A_002]